MSKEPSQWLTNGIKSTAYRGAASLEVTNEFSERYANISAREFLRVANEKIKMLFL